MGIINEPTNNFCTQRLERIRVILLAHFPILISSKYLKPQISSWFKNWTKGSLNYKKKRIFKIKFFAEGKKFFKKFSEEEILSKFTYTEKYGDSFSYINIFKIFKTTNIIMVQKLNKRFSEVQQKKKEYFNEFLAKNFITNFYDCAILFYFV